MKNKPLDENETSIASIENELAIYAFIIGVINLFLVFN